MSDQPETSLEALRSKPEKERDGLRKRILEMIRKAGPKGLTGYEIKIELKGMARHSTIYPRMTELEEDCSIRDSGRRRKTDTGREARVMVYVEEPPSKLVRAQAKLEKLYRERERLAERIHQAERERDSARREAGPQKELFA